MRGLDPCIRVHGTGELHFVACTRRGLMGCRVKPGNDSGTAYFPATFRSAALIRSCHPGPSAWKKSSTSRSMRRLTCSFAPGIDGFSGGRSAGLVVAGYNSLSLISAILSRCRSRPVLSA